MHIDIFPKQPYEKYPICMDYTKTVNSDSISSFSVLVKDGRGNDITNTITEPPTNIDNKVIVIVKNGVSGSKYIITFRIVTSSGYKYEDNVMMTIKV